MMTTHCFIVSSRPPRYPISALCFKLNIEVSEFALSWGRREPFYSFFR